MERAEEVAEVWFASVRRAEVPPSPAAAAAAEGGPAVPPAAECGVSTRTILQESRLTEGV